MLGSSDLLIKGDKSSIMKRDNGWSWLVILWMTNII